MHLIMIMEVILMNYGDDTDYYDGNVVPDDYK